jgi:hypothetical protein
MVTVALLGLWLAMMIARGTATGRSMRRWLVEKPAAQLSRIRRGTLWFVLLMVLMASATVWVMGHEGLQLFGMAMPELTSMMLALDVMSVLDTAVVVAIAATSVRWGAVRTAVVARLRGRARSARARRSRPVERPSANDDEDRAAGTLKLAA